MTTKELRESYTFTEEDFIRLCKKSAEIPKVSFIAKVTDLIEVFVFKCKRLLDVIEHIKNQKNKVFESLCEADKKKLKGVKVIQYGIIVTYTIGLIALIKKKR